MADYSITTADSPLPDDARVIHAGLRAYNELHAGPQNHRDVQMYLRDHTGAVRGGLLGKQYWGWLCVDTLWVEEPLRGRGFGSRLLGEAEQQARAAGCSKCVLDTFEFQALPFYERRGYSVFGVLADYPPGFKRYYLWKDLS